jgi:hypothetical protein
LRDEVKNELSVCISISNHSKERQEFWTPPIVYLSKKLLPREQSFPTVERECYAIVEQYQYPTKRT